MSELEFKCKGCSEVRSKEERCKACECCSECCAMDDNCNTESPND